MTTVPDTKSYIVNQLIAIGNKYVKYFISNLPTGLAWHISLTEKLAIVAYYTLIVMTINTMFYT